MINCIQRIISQQWEAEQAAHVGIDVTLRPMCTTSIG